MGQRSIPLLAALTLMGAALPASAQTLEPVPVEGQPLGQNVNRVVQALEFLGTPLPRDTAQALQAAAKARDADKLQKLLDPHVLAVIRISPEERVKAARGPAKVVLQQGGY